MRRGILTPMTSGSKQYPALQSYDFMFLLIRANDEAFETDSGLEATISGVQRAGGRLRQSEGSYGAPGGQPPCLRPRLPTGRAEDFREHAIAEQARLKPDPVGDFCQGGAFCSMEFDGDKSRIVDRSKR